MKILLTIMLSLTVGLATSCKPKNYVEVYTAPGWGIVCGGRNCDSCKVVSVGYNGKIIYSHYYPMSIPDSTIKADSLKGVEMLKNQ